MKVRLSAVLLATAALACGKSTPPVDVQVAQGGATTAAAPATSAPADASPMTAPPLDAAAMTGPLPAGHPSMGGMQGMPAGHPQVAGGDGQPGPLVPVVPPGTGEGDKAVAWTAPADWQSEPPSNPMRRAQYKVPGAGGDGECVVFYFGPGQGGDAMSNAQRWAGQFADAQGKPALGTMKTHQAKVGDIDVLYVEQAGTYMEGAMTGAPVQPRQNYALYGAIAEGPDANWFFKMTGPAKTVEAQKAAFEKMIQSLKKGA